ncbi:MAG: hypothetical protein ABEJ04_02395 [Halobacteriaceae archaeon]
MIAITGDSEWAPAYAIEDAMALLDEYGVPGTFFTTGVWSEDGTTLEHDGIDFSRTDHERGLHPNFLQSKDEAAVLDEITDLFPDASGTRSHCLYTNTPLQMTHREYGIRYQSNYLLHGEPNVEPLRLGNWTVELPIYWEDDVWMRTGTEPPDPSALLDRPGLKVFNFHPPYVFLNVPDEDRLSRWGEQFGNGPDAARAARYEGYGDRDLLVDLLEEVEASSETVRTLGDVAAEFLDR